MMLIRCCAVALKGRRESRRVRRGGLRFGVTVGLPSLIKSISGIGAASLRVSR